jgi:hypothetical protein
MVSYDMSQLHRMVPNEAENIDTFTTMDGHISTVYRVSGRAGRPAAPTVCRRWYH